MKKLINLANFTQTIDKFNKGKESLEDFWICGDLGLGLINQI